MEAKKTTIGGLEVYAIRSFRKIFFNSNYYGCLCIAEVQDDYPEGLSYKLYVGNRQTLGSPSVCRPRVLAAVKRFIRKEFKGAMCPVKFSVEDKDLDELVLTVSCTL